MVYVTIAYIRFVKSVYILIFACACSDGTPACEDVPAACGGVPAACSGPDLYRTRIAATGLDAYEGAVVRVASESRFCRSTLTTEVLAGAFQLVIDNRTDVSVEVYPIIGAFIDIDGDGACVAEPAWSTATTAVVGREVARSVMGSDFGDDPYGVCASFAP